eukprot:6303410-Karenia_brevis.AAC.1
MWGFLGPSWVEVGAILALSWVSKLGDLGATWPLEGHLKMQLGHLKVPKVGHEMPLTSGSWTPGEGARGRGI